MAIFCLDIGNTHAHWGLVDGRQVLAHGDAPSPEFTAASLAALLALHPSAGLALASVVPAITARLQPALLAGGRRCYHLRHDTVAGLGFDYPRPEEIGQDRLADCIGAQLVVGAPAIIVGMGTATTIDILTERGYAGGIIAPGLGVMTRYLHERTALLPALDPATLLGGPAIGKSTIDAMRAGCALGFAGMMGALLDAVSAELAAQGSPSPRVIVTGGAAIYLPAGWQARATHQPHLTLLGLAEAYRRHVA